MESFTPFAITSSDVPGDIVQIAEEHNLQNHEVEFSIISTTTFYRHGENEEKVVNKIFTDEELREPSLRFRQEHELEIHPKVTDPEFNLILTLMANKTKTKIYLFVDPRSKVPLNNSVMNKMLEAILIKKLRLGLYINIFEPNMEEEIKKFLKFLQEEKKLKKHYRMLVAQSIDAQKGVPAEITYHYKRKKKRNSDIFNDVFKDELIAEYTKEEDVKGGRTCLGEYIEPLKSDENSPRRVDYDENSVDIEENDTTIFYYANFEGEVQYTDDILSVLPRNSSLKNENQNLEKSTVKNSTNRKSIQEKESPVSTHHIEEEEKKAPVYTHHIEEKEKKAPIYTHHIEEKEEKKAPIYTHIEEKEEPIRAYKYVDDEPEEPLLAYKYKHDDEEEVEETPRAYKSEEEDDGDKPIYYLDDEQAEKSTDTASIDSNEDTTTHNIICSDDEDDFANRKLNILVVDDALIIRKSLKRMLEELGHTVLGESADGLESIEDYKKHHPDLVTMDITMPNMNGIEAVAEIKKIDPNARIIMVTSHGQEDMVIGAIKAGAKGYLLKPITPLKIRAELEKFSAKYHTKETKAKISIDEDEDEDFLM